MYTYIFHSARLYVLFKGDKAISLQIGVDTVYVHLIATLRD